MSSKFKSTFLAILLAVLMVAGLGQTANAQLAAVGPLNPVTNFPVWFQDQAGLSLGLCDEGGTAAEQPPCIPELTVGGAGFIAGNIVEALYYGATAVGDLPGGAGRFLGICAVEAAGGATRPGDSVSNIALIRLSNLTVVGDYTIEMPCGTFTGTITDPAVDDEIRGEIVAIGAPPDYVGALGGPVQFFASNGTAGAQFPGHLGDGITPGPLSNAIQQGGIVEFRVSGAVNHVADQFSVVGKIFALAPVASPTPPVTFTRDAAGAGTVDFQIPAPVGATTAQVSSADPVNAPLPGEPILLTLAAGVFTGSTAIVAPDPLAVPDPIPPLPANVEVTFNLGIVGESIQTLPLTDKIVGLTVAGVADPVAAPSIVANADGTLTVSAASSNQFETGDPAAAPATTSLPTLSVTDPAGGLIGTIPGSGGSFIVPAPAPTAVIITSVASTTPPAGAILDPAGGTVTLLNPAVAPDPVAGGGFVGGGGGGGGCFITDLLGW